MATTLDPNTTPGAHDVAATVRSGRPRWDRLVDWIGTTYGVVGEPLCSGHDSGWVLRFRRSGKALLTLSPRADGGFEALVVIGPSAWESVASVPLSPTIREAWDAARPYPDGRWLFLDVTDDGIVGDIERLIALKSPPPRHVRRRVPSPA